MEYRLTESWSRKPDKIYRQKKLKFNEKSAFPVFDNLEIMSHQNISRSQAHSAECDMNELLFNPMISSSPQISSGSTHRGMVPLSAPAGSFITNSGDLDIPDIQLEPHNITLEYQSNNHPGDSARNQSSVMLHGAFSVFNPPSSEYILSDKQKDKVTPSMLLSHMINNQEYQEHEELNTNWNSAPDQINLQKYWNSASTNTQNTSQNLAKFMKFEQDDEKLASSSDFYFKANSQPCRDVRQRRSMSLKRSPKIMPYNFSPKPSNTAKVLDPVIDQENNFSRNLKEQKLARESWKILSIEETQKRSVHKIAEQRRRDLFREALDDLKAHLIDASIEKLNSKIDVVRAACKFIREQDQKINTLEQRLQEK